jgi:hypothetical protein
MLFLDWSVRTGHQPCKAPNRASLSEFFGVPAIERRKSEFVNGPISDNADEQMRNWFWTEFFALNRAACQCAGRVPALNNSQKREPKRCSFTEKTVKHNPLFGRLSSFDSCIMHWKSGNYINDGLSKEPRPLWATSEWIGNTNTSNEQGGEGESRGSAA